MRVQNEDYKELIHTALKEDLDQTGDITTMATIPDNQYTKASVVAKQDGVLCGKEVFSDVFKMIDSSIEIRWAKNDGDFISNQDKIAQLSGSTRSILEGERTALNFLQRMSGIATVTNEYQKIVEPYGIKILDTRKTLPGFRLLDKYSVYTGGGTNHRMGLFDMVLIKENHIKSAGSVQNAIEKVLEQYNQQYKIEVETENLQEVKTACQYPIHQIMLDHFTKQEIIEAVKIIHEKNENIKIEVSGNITKSKLEELKDTGIDYISIGFLTHSVQAFDFSLLIL